VEATVELGIEPKHVTFYDFDGVVFCTYTREEAANLSSLPDLPLREGMKYTGWSHTLDDVKSVKDDECLDVAALCEPEDGKTRLYMEFESAACPVVNISFTQGRAHLATIDWGDGSEPSSSSTIGSTYLSHDYSAYLANTASSVKKVTIVISRAEVESGNPSLSLGSHAEFQPDDFGTSLAAGLSNLFYRGGGGQFCYGSEEDNDLASKFDNCITISNRLVAVELGENVTLDQLCFSHCSNLRYITTASTTGLLPCGVCQDCHSLRFFTVRPDGFPKGPDDFDGTQPSDSDAAFRRCYGLETVVLSNGVLSVPTRCFASCINLKHIIIPGSVSFGFGFGAFENTRGARVVVIKDGVKKIPPNAFNLQLYNDALLEPSEGISQTGIADGVFVSNGVTKLKIPSSVGRIYARAFQGWRALRTLDLTEFSKDVSIYAIPEQSDTVGIFGPFNSSGDAPSPITVASDLDIVFSDQETLGWYISTTKLGWHRYAPQLTYRGAPVTG
jgi:hypothetical protein